ncbi:hypothetical protein GALL_375750 [mine drainage metagenome]|uniref:Uncharacterized protein n=1 Tax=mine drainage metagenome TaxID=410659 RepID=A0A1J5QL21_9ZZZZ
MVDHDGAAGRQAHFARKGRLDLVFDLEAREQRHFVAVQFDARHIARHHVVHELHGLFVDFRGVDQDFADIGLEIIADGADHQTAFLVDQEGALLQGGGAFNRGPQLQQVIQVPLQFFQVAADAGGTGDHAHAGGDFQLRHDVAQFVAVFTLDAARNAAAARIVGHQYEVAAGQADERGEGSALVAAFVLVHLDDQFLAFAQRFLDAGAAVGVALEIAACHFLERQKAVAIGAVIDKAGFEGRLDAGDDALVDVALALFLAGVLDIEIDQFLPVDNGDTELFSLCRIK